MAIDGVGNSAVSNQDLFTSTGAVHRRGHDDEDHRASSGAGGLGRGGRFMEAISDAFTQVGVTPPAANNASAGAASSTDGNAFPLDPAQSLKAFATSLFSALRVQDNGSSHPSGGANNRVEGGLQNLIRQLSAGGAATASGSAPADGEENPLLTLQATFDKFAAANGGIGGAANLKAFLQDLAHNLQGVPSSGNVVNTSA